jgi:hypothetical protein
VANNDNIYGEVENETDLRDIFKQIRKDVEEVKDRSELTELYRRAGYLITLSYAPSWEEKFGDDAKELREVAEDEFETTANKVNTQAKKIGTDADYDTKWGKMKND